MLPLIFPRWECKFLAEGIIDQGGGFRDSLSDIADELCPSDCDSLLPLPFFIRYVFYLYPGCVHPALKYALSMDLAVSMGSHW